MVHISQLQTSVLPHISKFFDARMHIISTQGYMNISSYIQIPLLHIHVNIHMYAYKYVCTCGWDRRRARICHLGCWCLGSRIR
jgi:hypothetical protein